VHPPLASELAHPGVDEREAGAALAPGGEVLVRVVPVNRAPVPLSELVASVARVVEQQLAVEVAPAELAPKGLRASPARQPLLELAWRYAAEAQVGREPRGALAVERVVPVVVPAHGPVEEGAHPRTAGGLAAGDGLGRLLLEPKARERREAPLREPARERRQPVRRGERLAPCCRQPGAVIGGEHGLGPSPLGVDLARRVNGVEPWMGVKLDGLRCERLPHEPSASAGIGRDVGADVDRVGTRLARQRRQLALRRSVSDDQPVAALGERGVERSQALEHELRPRPGGVPAVQQPVVEAEDRHEPVGARTGRLERRQIVHPQVAAVPE
jgi:hypothetical protein